MSIRLDGPLVLVGAGNMGGALVKGLIERGLQPTEILVQDPAPPAGTAAYLATLGIEATASLPAARGPARVILLAVKPQIMDAVAPSVAPLAGPDTLVVSVAAGRTIASIARHFPPGTAIVRTIPNTPAAIGRGITVAVADAAVPASQRALASNLLAAVGEVGWVEDEALIDAATAVSGSGPAYVFLLAECLAAAGREVGLAPELAARLARATISGAGELLFRTADDPALLRRNVTSPNGTTAAALAVLMAADGLEPLMVRAVVAARRRAAALAG